MERQRQRAQALSEADLDALYALCYQRAAAQAAALAAAAPAVAHPAVPAAQTGKAPGTKLWRANAKFVAPIAVLNMAKAKRRPECQK